MRRPTQHQQVAANNTTMMSSRRLLFFPSFSSTLCLLLLFGTTPHVTSFVFPKGSTFHNTNTNTSTNTNRRRKERLEDSPSGLHNAIDRDYDLRAVREQNDISIEYCTGCRWMLRSAWMAQEALSTFKNEIASVTLIPVRSPAPGGIFVSVSMICRADACLFMCVCGCTRLYSVRLGWVLEEWIYKLRTESAEYQRNLPPVQPHCLLLRCSLSSFSCSSRSSSSCAHSVYTFTFYRGYVGMEMRSCGIANKREVSPKHRT